MYYIKVLIILMITRAVTVILLSLSNSKNYMFEASFAQAKYSPPPPPPPPPRHGPPGRLVLIALLERIIVRTVTMVYKAGCSDTSSVPIKGVVR